jgi:alanine dehydrogenase
MRILTASDVTALLDLPSCIRSVEDAFRARGEGEEAPSGVMGLALDEGTLHVKAARLRRDRDYTVAKINANFPRNPLDRGLPTIQGVLILIDSSCGTPLAAMDSGALTTIRTAAASAVAASWLARSDATTVTFIGCGVQARAHLAALRAVRPIRHVFAIDQRSDVAARFRDFAIADHGVSCERSMSLSDATRRSEIVVTATPASRPLLQVADVAPGTFVAAVGADNEHKNEIDPALMGAAAVVVDSLEQCSHMGDLHHALIASTMRRTDVRASLDQVIVGARPGRKSDAEIIVFDSTGVAIEDVAAAAVVLERAMAANAGVEIMLNN